MNDCARTCVLLPPDAPMNRFLNTVILSATIGLLAPPTLFGATPSKAIRSILAVGAEGQGNAEAAVAWQDLAKSNASVLIDILEAMGDANPISLNWLRSAVDTIAARELSAGRKLPVSRIEKFLGDTAHHPRARRLAYELIAQAEPDRAESLIAKMLDDPSPELRRDAVERLVAEAKQLREAAIAKYEMALKSARESEQIEAVAKTLKELGRPVKLANVFGWVSEWQVIGPFDSAGGAGFANVFAPEQAIDLQGEYDGKSGKVRWQPLTTTNDFGLVDLNKPLGSLKGVAGYAYAEIAADKARVVELRLGCKNAWKVWHNGKFLFGRDEYHRGMEIDQYRLKTELQPGKNAILVKVCQNEQTEEWTKEWEFQLRITDALGTPIDFARR
jgi:hypothetical protein